MRSPVEHESKKTKIKSSVSNSGEASTSGIKISEARVNSSQSSGQFMAAADKRIQSESYTVVPVFASQPPRQVMLIMQDSHRRPRGHSSALFSHTGRPEQILPQSTTPLLVPRPIPVSTSFTPMIQHSDIHRMLSVPRAFPNSDMIQHHQRAVGPIELSPASRPSQPTYHNLPPGYNHLKRS